MNDRRYHKCHPSSDISAFCDLIIVNYIWLFLKGIDEQSNDYLHYMFPDTHMNGANHEQ